MEGIIKLKDGRRLFTTHNGFRYWVEDKNGFVTEVTSEYYNRTKKNRV